MEGKDTFGLALFGQQALETLVHDDLLALRTDLFEACVVLCEREARILHREKGGETPRKNIFFSLLRVKRITSCVPRPRVHLPSMQTTLNKYFTGVLTRHEQIQRSNGEPVSVSTDNSSSAKSTALSDKLAEPPTLQGRFNGDDVKPESLHEGNRDSESKESQNASLADDIDWTKLKKLSEDLDGSYWSFNPLMPRKRKAVQYTFAASEMTNTFRVKRKGSKKEARNSKKESSKAMGTMMKTQDVDVNKLAHRHHHRHHHQGKHHHSKKKKENEMYNKVNHELFQEATEEDIVPPSIIDQPSELPSSPKRESVLHTEAKMELLDSPHQQHKMRTKSTASTGLDGSYWAVDDTKPRRRTRIEFFTEQEQQAKKKKKVK